MGEMDEPDDETTERPQPRWMAPSLLVGAALMLLVLLAVLRVF